MTWIGFILSLSVSSAKTQAFDYEKIMWEPKHRTHFKPNRTMHSCKRPKDTILRHGSAWVHIDEYTVTKHPSGRNEYYHEKKMGQLLSPFTNFVKLLSWDDECELIVEERIFPAKPQNIDWHYVEHQINGIWSIFDRLRITPSTEFFYGFCCNMFIGIHNNITMFDFHAYHFENYNASHNLEIKEKLLQILHSKN